MSKTSFTLLFFWFSLATFAQWAAVPSPTSQNLHNLTFTDSLTGFICGTDVILKTVNGGDSWFPVHSSSTGEPIVKINFPSKDRGYAISSYTFLKSTDQGNTWNSVALPTTVILRGLFFQNADTGYISGQGEEIWRTNDGGSSWIQLNSGIYWLRQFSFPSASIGYCVGDGHAVYKTYNGGKNWLQLTGFSNPNLTDVFFLSPDTGYICGNEGYVAVTTDGGYSWHPFNTPTTANLAGFSIIDFQKIYAVGDLGVIIKSVDAGQSWTNENSGTNLPLGDIFMLKSGKGFIAGNYGTILVNETCTKAMFNYTIENQNIYFQDESACAQDFLWDFGDGYYSSLQNPWHTYDEQGSYMVCLTATDSATHSSDKYCKQILITTVNELSGKPVFAVFPNPCTDQLTLETSPDKKIRRVEMYDSKGIRAVQKELNSSPLQILHLSFNPAQGLYMVVVTMDDDSRVTARVVVNQ